LTKNQPLKTRFQLTNDLKLQTHPAQTSTKNPLSLTDSAKKSSKTTSTSKKFQNPSTRRNTSKKRLSRRNSN